ncbi:hypothetical protein ABBQ38_002358 [Trebouxia sp. C0009 RCD-2024]
MLQALRPQVVCARAPGCAVQRFDQRCQSRSCLPSLQLTRQPCRQSFSKPAGVLRSKTGLQVTAAAAASSGTSGAPTNQPSQPVSKKSYSAASAVSVSNTTGTGVFILLLLNLVIFVLDHQLHLPQIQRLYLDHIAPKWWQFITCSFCHASWAHLSSNTFLLYVFGKIVEEEEGLWGVWFTYIITAVGASVASYFLQPKASISLGASGAVFGLFAVSVLVKLSFNLKKLIECGILGQFVIKQLLQEAMSMKAGSTVIAGHRVGHVAHLGGALAGVILVYLLSRLPGVPKR